MRRAVRLVLPALLLGLPLAAQQDATGAERARAVGIGVTLNPALLVSFDEDVFFSVNGLNNFMVPIRVSPNLMIEPEIGAIRWATSGSGSGFSSSSTLSNLRLGVGVLALMRERGGLRPYVGPRVGVVRNREHSKYTSSGFNSENDSKRDDWYVSAVLGAQYFFTAHFSLGGEAQVTRTSIGQEEQEPSQGTPPSDYSNTIIGTSGLIMLRWFF